MTANPWDVLAQHHPDVVVVRWPIRELGRYYHQLRTIVVRKGLPLVEERSVLWHEIVHLERGDETCMGKYERTQIDRQAARRAIDIHELADAIRGREHLAEVADELKVTEALLRARLDHLHPSERGLLRRVTHQMEHTA